MFYCGSELGAVDLDGETFNLQPAKPIVIDLEKHSIEVCHPDEKVQSFHEAQIKALKKCIPTVNQMEPISFKPDELMSRKLRGGWSEEVDREIIQPLFKHGKDKIV